MDPPILYDPTVHSYLIPSLSSLHATCILTPPYMIATFMPPLNDSVMLAWWTSRSQEVSGGTRAIIMQLAKNEDGGEVVAGVVMLGMPESEEGPFRGYVEKLLVSPDWRQKGIAKRMMEKIEAVAKENGRGMLLLDTTQGDPAELIYPRMGYIRIGIIPNYLVAPLDGSLRGGVFFYKDMR